MAAGEVDVVNHDHLPTYKDLLLPTLKAVADLGGSAHIKEIDGWIIQHLPVSEADLAIEYPDRPGESVILDRMAWARSYNKLGGALERPQRGLYLLSAFGREVVGLPDADAVERVIEMDREVRRARSRKKPDTDAPIPDEDESDGNLEDDEELGDDDLRAAYLSRLHSLTPNGFEKYVIFLLKSYGLELEPTGRSGDEGIDAIGLAPISDVLSYRVAVQVKRHDPTTATSTVDRSQVALFQRDAAAKGAERAVFVTLGSFSAPAQKAATDTTPTVDLVDGKRLWELAKKKGHGLRQTTVIVEDFFEDFE